MLGEHAGRSRIQDAALWSSSEPEDGRSCPRCNQQLLEGPGLVSSPVMFGTSKDVLEFRVVDELEFCILCGSSVDAIEPMRLRGREPR